MKLFIPPIVAALLAVATTAVAQPAYVNIQDFGAVPGDGIDDGPAIQAAFDALDQQRGGTVFCPPGTYDISTPIIVKGVAMRLLGDAGPSYNEDPPYAGCSLVARVNGMTMLQFRRKDLDHRGLVLEYVNLRDGTPAGHSATLLDIYAFNRWTLRNVTLNYAQTGVRITGADDASWGYVSQLFCKESKTCIDQTGVEGGFLLLGGGIEPLVTGIRVRGSQVRVVGAKFDCAAAAATGIWITGHAAAVMASTFELCGTGILAQDDGSMPWNGDQNRFIGNHFLAAGVDNSIGISLSLGADGNQLVGNTYEYTAVSVRDKGANNTRLEQGSSTGTGVGVDVNMNCGPGQAIKGLNVSHGSVIGITCGQP